MGMEVKLTVLGICLTSLILFSNCNEEPPETIPFEAAFQGKCGRGSPCAQLCREFHDGTYECGCRSGFSLNLDGYSCQEVNTTFKSLMNDNYIDSEEDVLYQKDASFSAELDMAMLPAREIENRSSTSQSPTPDQKKVVENTLKKSKQEEERIRNEFLSKYSEYDHIGTPLFDAKKFQARRQNNEEDKVLLSPVAERLMENNDTYKYRMYKELAGLDSLKANGLSAKDIDMIANAEIDGAANRMPQEDPTLITTTLGPSLEQKVPSMSTSEPRGHTLSASAERRSKCSDSGDCHVSNIPDKPPSTIQTIQPGEIPQFGGSGWLSLPALRGAYKRVRLHIQFKPTTSEGILLLSGERDDMTGDYLAILLRRGKVELIFDCGSGPGVVSTESSVVLNQWNTLTLYRKRWDAWIQLNGGKHMQGRSKGLFSRMTFLLPVFVGGGGNSSGLDRLPVQIGFSGCVRLLNINGRTYKLETKPKGDAISEYAVGICGSSGCGHGCLHGGRCVKHCLCPLGYAGDFCENLLDLKVPRFNGSSYLRYHGLGDTALSWLELQITLKVGSLNGLIMYNSHRLDGIGDYFALYLRKGHIEFAFDLGTGQAIIKCSEKIKLDEWYSINVSRTGRLAVLTIFSHRVLPNGAVEGESYTSQGMTPGAFTQLSLTQSLYLGGVPQFRGIQKRLGINESFVGCIQKVIINDHEQSIVSSALGGVNIDGCSHSCTPGACGEASCRPNLHHYTCVCSPGVTHELCTIFLNETSEEHTNFTDKQDVTGQQEITESSVYSGFDHNKHENIVPKKGIKWSRKHHSYEIEETTESSSTQENSLGSWISLDDSLSDEMINLDRKQKEWILSDKNDENEDYHQHSDIFKMFTDHLHVENEDNELKPMNVDGHEKRPILDIDMEESEYIEIPQFTGHDSYIRNSNPDVLKKMSSHSLDINIRFRSLSSHGLLLWLGKDGMAPGDTFMGLGIEEGLLTFRYDFGSGEVIIVANQTRVDDGLWHRARAARKGQSGVLEIDGLGAVGKASPGKVRPLNVDSGLYIGGMASIWPETVGTYRYGIKGCISKLIINRELQVPLSTSISMYTTSRNIDKCPP